MAKAKNRSRPGRRLGRKNNDWFPGGLAVGRRLEDNAVEPFLGPPTLGREVNVGNVP